MAKSKTELSYRVVDAQDVILSIAFVKLFSATMSASTFWPTEVIWKSAPTCSERKSGAEAVSVTLPEIALAAIVVAPTFGMRNGPSSGW